VGKRSEVIYTLYRNATLREKVKAYYVQTPRDQAGVIAQQTQWGDGGGNGVVILGGAGICARNRKEKGSCK
jgi:hypothetical protein